MYVITSKCVKCGTCSKGCPITPGCDGHTCRIQCGTGLVCPAGAIIEGETQYIITDRCIDCGRCAIFCPHGAIIPGPSYKKESKNKLTEDEPVENEQAENELIKKLAVNI